MAKIIQFNATRKRPESGDARKRDGCDHRQVIAYTYYRTVRCSICGVELDPFDVLVDMLKAHVPAGESKLEEDRLLREVERREEEKSDREK